MVNAATAPMMWLCACVRVLARPVARPWVGVRVCHLLPRVVWSCPRTHRAFSLIFCPMAMPCWWGLTIGRPKQLSMAATAQVIVLCACVRYWPDRGLVYECVTCFYWWIFLSPVVKCKKANRSVWHELGTKKKSENYNARVHIHYTLCRCGLVAYFQA